MARSIRHLRPLLLLACVAAIGACGAALTASPSAAPPGVSPGASSPAGQTPVPTGPVEATGEEIVLGAGLRLDLRGRCRPLRSGLPAAALAAVDCEPVGAAVDRAAIYLFDTPEAMLAAYKAWLAAAGMAIRQPDQSCGASGSEAGWLPGDDRSTAPMPQRQACQTGPDGRIRTAVTLPPFVLVTAEGPGGDPEQVRRWPWLGNLDQPGSPTIWRESGPVSPEK